MQNIWIYSFKKKSISVLITEKKHRKQTPVVDEEDVNEAVKTQDTKTSSQTGKGSFDSHTG